MYHKYFMHVFIALVCLASCGKNPKVVELKQAGLVVKLTKLPEDAPDNSTISYAVRLIPDKSLLANTDQITKTALQYRMDSCFYVINNHHKVYANIVQPIADGVADSFEYLLTFNLDNLKMGNWKLTYRDRYLNHRQYQLQLSKD